MRVDRRIVLLDAAVDSAPDAACVRWADRLAAPGDATLDVVALRRAGHAQAATLLAGDAQTTCWDCSLEGVGAAGVETIVAAWTDAFEQIGIVASQSCLVLVAPGAAAEEASARLAARLGGVSLGRCLTVRLSDAEVVASRAVCGGRACIDIASGAPIVVATVRSVPRTADGSARACDWNRLNVRFVASTAEELVEGQDARASVDGAPIVVCGGRGIGGADGMQLLAQLADRLGGAWGGSLPTVDAGWAPAARQIGQSGKFVSPSIYLAVGISGTPQHLAGISDESMLIAINNDAEAPIFEHAQVGAVADWRELVPLVIEAIDRQRSRGEPLGGQPLEGAAG